MGQNKKQKLYLLKNDILLSDLLLRYYHRLKQTNVKKQTNTKKLNKCTTLTTKNCDTYMCANFCFETPQIIQHNYIPTSLLSFKDAKQSKLLFSLFFAEFLV